jgi:hypothetical protein
MLSGSLRRCVLQILPRNQLAHAAASRPLARPVTDCFRMESQDFAQVLDIEAGQALFRALRGGILARGKDTSDLDCVVARWRGSY